MPMYCLYYDCNFRLLRSLVVWAFTWYVGDPGSNVSSLVCVFSWKISTWNETNFKTLNFFPETQLFSTQPHFTVNIRPAFGLPEKGTIEVNGLFTYFSLVIFTRLHLKHIVYPSASLKREPLNLTSLSFCWYFYIPSKYHTKENSKRIKKCALCLPNCCCEALGWHSI